MNVSPILLIASVFLGGLYLSVPPTLAQTPALTAFKSADKPAPATPIDTMVFGKLRQLGIQPARPCSDAAFVRRVYLDVIGTLPSAQEAREFLLDHHSDKRHILIDRLLERPEFADYWAMKWCELLRVKSEFPINLWPNAAQGYSHWIHAAIRDNMPYDRFARELLTANGSNFRDAQSNFYRAVQSRQPSGLAQTVALTFMGERAENWPKDRLSGMAGFFSQIGYKSTGEWKEEIVFFDTSKSAATTQPAAVFPDGTVARLAPDRDPREVFADWLTTPQNPWFTRNIVNRVWSWLLGRGIIHEPDDIRPDNPAVNPELLAYLQRELIASHYDLKEVYRLILNSQAYQLSCIPQSNTPKAAANFSAYPLRRLDAEVLIDALDQITGTTEKYSSAIPEPFTFIPETQRTIALPDGSITSPFLDMFGRPSRDTGLESERNNRPTADQRLHLLNSSHIHRKIEQSRPLQTLLQSKAPQKEIITSIYLTILSRFPTDQEIKVAETYAQSGNTKSREAQLDLIWSLINSSEFLYRH